MCKGLLHPLCVIPVCLPEFPQQFPHGKRKISCPKPLSQLTPTPAGFRGGLSYWPHCLCRCYNFVNSQSMRLNRPGIITITAQQFMENLFLFGDQQGTAEKRECAPHSSPAPSLLSSSPSSRWGGALPWVRSVIHRHGDVWDFSIPEEFSWLEKAPAKLLRMAVLLSWNTKISLPSGCCNFGCLPYSFCFLII